MASKLAQEASERFIDNYIQYASIAFVWYDFIITIGLEVRYIWRAQRLGWLSFAFIFLRYALVTNIIYQLAALELLSGGCNAWYKFDGVLSVLGRASLLTLLSIRAVGVCNKNRYVIIWLAFLVVVCVAFDISHVPGLRCSGSSSIPIVPILLAILVCIFEFSIAFVIGVRAWKMQVSDGPKLYKRGGLLDSLIQQGVLYFLGVFGLQLASVIIYFKPETNLILRKFLNAVTLPMSCALTARFTLNLRAMDARISESDSGGEGRAPPFDLSALQAAVPPGTSSMGETDDDNMRNVGGDEAYEFEDYPVRDEA